jgi:hypothetical protein
LLICLVLSVGLGLLQGRTRDKTELALIAACTLAALYSQQFLLLYAVAAAPPLAEMLFELAGRRITTEISPVSAVSLASATLAFALLLPVQHLSPAASEQAMAEVYPVHAVEYIKRTGLQGPMWNDFPWGGYLINALPGTPVSVDGRTEMYGNQFMYEYARVRLAYTPAQPVFDRYDINFALIEPNSPLASELRQSSDWRTAYEDPTAAIFVRRAGQNQSRM